MESQWVVDVTGDGALAASEVAAAAPPPYCACTGFCRDHLHFMADETPVGAVVVSFPRETVEGKELSDQQLAPVYMAAVYHSKVRTIVRIPAWVGRKRPMPKFVLSTILEVVALLPEHISSPWRSVSVSSFVQVDDQRECANLASLVRNYMLPDQSICRVAVQPSDEAKYLAQQIFGPLGMQRRASSTKVPATPTKAKRTDHDHLRQLQAELLETEQTYYKTIEMLETKFYRELEASARGNTPIIPMTDVQQIFSGLPKIVAFTRELLADLEKCTPSAASGSSVQLTSANIRSTSTSGKALHVEGVFLKHIKGFQAYLTYVSYYAKALQTVRKCRERSPNFESFLAQSQSLKDAHRMNLEGMLIAPIQRIPRYELFLSQMLKSTTEEYQWHNELKEALQQIHDVGQATDDATRRASAHLALFNIQETVHHCPPTVVSANRTYLGSFNCQEAHPRTGTHLSNYWTLHLCDDMLVIARRTAKSSFLKLVAGAKKEDRRKWTYDFYRLIRLDDLQVVTYTASAKDQVVTLEWPRANAEGPDGSRLQVGPGDAAVESLTVTTIADDADRTSASDTSFAMVTMAAASMANTHGASPDHDNMASFANKISKAISDWSEKTQQVQAPKHMVKIPVGPSTDLTLESIYLVRPVNGWHSQATHGNFEPAPLLLITSATTTTAEALASVPASLLDATYLVGHLQSAPLGGFRAAFVARATAGGINQLPPIAPDCRGQFDAQAAAEAATMLSMKLIHGQAAYFRNVLHRTAFGNDGFGSLLVQFVQAQVSSAEQQNRPVRRVSSLRRKPSRNGTSEAVTPTGPVSRQTSASSISSPSWSATFSGQSIRRVGSVKAAGVSEAATDGPITRARPLALANFRSRRGQTLALVVDTDDDASSISGSVSGALDMGTPLRSSSTTPPAMATLADSLSPALLADLTAEQRLTLELLTQLIQAIERHVLTRGDLYNMPPRRRSNQVKFYHAVDLLLPSIEQPLNAALLDTAELPTLCGAVWKLLGLLKEPLVPQALQADFYQACNWEYARERSGMLRATMQRVPVYEWLMLRTLLPHLRRCVDLPGNKCTYQLLDGQFRPLIVRDRAVARDGDIHSLVDPTEEEPALVASLLENAQVLFVPAPTSTPVLAAQPMMLAVSRPTSAAPRIATPAVPRVDMSAMPPALPPKDPESPPTGPAKRRRTGEKENEIQQFVASTASEAKPEVIAPSSRLLAARMSIAQMDVSVLSAQRQRMELSERLKASTGAPQDS